MTSDDWPEAELRAAVLAGELVAVGACWASPVEPQTPSLRAAAAAWMLRDPRLIAGTRTAAWIWGATSRPPTPLEAAISPQARVHVDAGVRLREVVIDPADVVRLGGPCGPGGRGDLGVTTPMRTAIDLLRTPSTGERTFGTAESEALRGAARDRRGHRRRGRGAAVRARDDPDGPAGVTTAPRAGGARQPALTR